jgi:hypothetical protein
LQRGQDRGQRAHDDLLDPRGRAHIAHLGVDLAISGTAIIFAPESRSSVSISRSV